MKNYENKEIILKSISKYFDELSSGDKKCTIRFNDKDFQIGDVIIFKEYDNDSETFSGRSIKARITHITRINEIVDLYPEYKNKQKVSNELVAISIKIIK